MSARRRGKESYARQKGRLYVVVANRNDYRSFMSSSNPHHKDQLSSFPTGTDRLQVNQMMITVIW